MQARAVPPGAKLTDVSEAAGIGVQPAAARVRVDDGDVPGADGTRIEEAESDTEATDSASDNRHRDGPHLLLPADSPSHVVRPAHPGSWVGGQVAGDVASGGIRAELVVHHCRAP